jgi:simple sugar transport system ATP-binding protein
MMVGREVDLFMDKKEPNIGDVVFKVNDLVVTDDRSQVTVDGVSLEVHKGEILGVAGVQGNGQTELVEALTGLRKSVSGEINLCGHSITHATPRKITELGMAHIPEDRQRDGLILGFPVYENLVLNTYYLAPHAKGAVVHWDEVVKDSYQLIKDFDIRTPGPFTNAEALSGGNQQKVIVARELTRPIEFLIASQPTRGLDVGSIEYIHKQILAKRDSGVGVLLVSTELAEIQQLADRIIVMYRGKVVAVVDAAEATKEYLGLLMAGIPQDEAKKQVKTTQTSIGREIF